MAAQALPKEPPCAFCEEIAHILFKNFLNNEYSFEDVPLLHWRPVELHYSDYNQSRTLQLSIGARYHTAADAIMEIEITVKQKSGQWVQTHYSIHQSKMDSGPVQPHLRDTPAPQINDARRIFYNVILPGIKMDIKRIRYVIDEAGEPSQPVPRAAETQHTPVPHFPPAPLLLPAAAPSANPPSLAPPPGLAGKLALYRRTLTELEEQLLACWIDSAPGEAELAIHQIATLSHEKRRSFAQLDRHKALAAALYWTFADQTEWIGHYGAIATYNQTDDELANRPRQLAQRIYGVRGAITAYLALQGTTPDEHESIELRIPNQAPGTSWEDESWLLRG